MADQRRTPLRVVLVASIAVVALLGWKLARTRPGEPTVTPSPSVKGLASSAVPESIASTSPDRPSQAARKIDPQERARLLEALGRALARPASGDRPSVGAASNPAGGADDGPPQGQLSAKYIKERIDDIKPLIKECYDLARSAAPRDKDLSGRLDLEFEIVADPELGGLVETARVDEKSTLSDPTLSECVRATVSSIEFPPPSAGGRVRVRYPFVFKEQ